RAALPARVVTDSAALWAELPTSSTAATVKRYVVLETRFKILALFVATCVTSVPSRNTLYLTVQLPPAFEAVQAKSTLLLAWPGDVRRLGTGGPWLHSAVLVVAVTAELRAEALPALSRARTA